MNILIKDTNITLQKKDASASYTLFSKPDIADYGNVTARPLVTSYHLVRESIWERLCQCMKELERSCQNSAHYGCYALAMSALYPFLLANNQAKNVLYYGSSDANPFLIVLQDFMRFLRTDNSLVLLPHNPAVFSGLANNTWHAVVINLDGGDNLQTICDAVTKVRINGTVLFYTASDVLPDHAAPLLSHFEKTCFSSCSVYTCTMDSELNDFVYPCTAEASVLTNTEKLFTQMEKLRFFVQNTEQGNLCSENCLDAMKQLCQIENILFASYDYLENPEVPVFANTLKEAVMDCCAGLTDPIDTQIYRENLLLTARIFFSAIEQEFQ